VHRTTCTTCMAATGCVRSGSVGRVPAPVTRRNGRAACLHVVFRRRGHHGFCERLRRLLKIPPPPLNSTPAEHRSRPSTPLVVVLVVKNLQSSLQKPTASPSPASELFRNFFSNKNQIKFTLSTSRSLKMLAIIASSTELSEAPVRGI